MSYYGEDQYYEYDDDYEYEDSYHGSWYDWNSDYGDPGDYDSGIYEEEYYDD